MTEKNNDIGFFERYLSVWVVLCIAVGVLLGAVAPEFAKTLDAMSINVNGAPVVSIPITICLFFMMYPIILKKSVGSLFLAQALDSTALQKNIRLTEWVKRVFF